MAYGQGLGEGVFRSREEVVNEGPHRRRPAETGQGIVPEPPPGPRPAARPSRRRSRWAAVLAGMLLDGVDFMTMGPIGLSGGFLFGAVAGWWAAREFGFEARGRWWMALAGAVYAATPATEFLPLGTLAGALRFTTAPSFPPTRAGRR